MATIVVTVAWATPSIEELVDVELPAGSSAGDAIARSGLVAAYGLDLARLGVAIFGRRAALASAVDDGDRVEITRALPADAKQARRERALAAPNRTRGKPGG